MARTGRPPKPVETKRKTGNPGHRTLPEPAVVVAQTVNVPDPLRPLGQIGLAFWSRVWAHGRAWISPTTDLDAIQLLAEQMDERAIMYQQVIRQQAAGEVDWRLRKQLRDLDTVLARGLASIGFTPEMRTRLGLAEVRAQHAIESLISRRANRATS